MKNYTTILALCISVFAAAQNFSQYSIQENIFKDNTKLPDFSYYSNNYNIVFGEYNYTFNTNTFGKRNVYVADNRFYHYGSQHLPYQPMLNPGYGPHDNNSAAMAIGISVVGLKALFDGNAFAKDYTPKDIDKSLFHPGE